jgi:manganese transport protein
MAGLDSRDDVIAPDEIIAFDPYALPPEDVEDPPKTLWAALRKIGPGIILAGTIVGSGELILTTSLGARFGFVFMWLILFSCVIKVFVQIELGRYAISSGMPTLGALNSLPGRTTFGHPLIWWWLIMMFFTTFQLGGMTSGIGQAFNLAFPAVAASTSDALASVSPSLAEFVRTTPAFPWAVLICLTTMALIYGGGYRRIERLTTAIVIGVTLITMTAAIALGWTDYPVHGGDFVRGLKPGLPDDPAGIAEAFAVFGITGVGASELFFYPYWCLEKGYARYVGKRDDSEAWAQRARGWIRVMHLDAWVSMVVFTISTIAFYVMGAAVLKPQNLNPKGTELIETLSEMFVGPFGVWTRTLFLIGAAAVLFKTLYLSCAANSRLTTDFLSLSNIVPNPSPQKRAVVISRFCLFFPVLAFVLFLLMRDPKLMVKIGGIAQAATLPMIAICAAWFRYRRVDPRVQPWRSTDVLLWIAVISISIVAAFTVWTGVDGLVSPTPKA